VVYVLSTTVMQGIVPNADLANSSAPFAYVYAQMFNPTVGKIIMGLAVLACVGSLLGWQFTISMVAKATADERLFPQFYSKVNRHGAPVIGLMVAAVLQTFTAASTASPNASEVFNQLVNLTAVTILIPYITSISALMVVMRKAEVSESLYRINLVAVFVSMAYCFYALYASGIQAVFGATLVMMVGYLLFGFVAYRFVVAENPAPRGVSPG
jgi:putrescine:ornithine antiporter